MGDRPWSTTTTSPYPTDLLVVSAVAGVGVFAVYELEPGSVERIALVVPLLIALPGYALLSALFPARERLATDNVSGTAADFPGGIDLVERLSLSLALSVILIPVVGMGLLASRWELSPRTAVVSLAILTVLCSFVGAVRRYRLAPAVRYQPAIVDGVRSMGPDSEGERIERASAVLLTIAILLATGSLALGFVAPQTAGGHVEVAVLTTNDDELVAGGYPDELAPGESAALVLTIENRHENPVNYSVVVQEQHLVGESVIDRTELDRFDGSVNASERAEIDHSLSVTGQAETVRVVYLVYAGDPPAEPTRENADEDVYLWITTTDE